MLTGFDFETHLIAPGRLAPRPVCLTVDYGAGPSIFTADSTHTMLDAVLAMLQGNSVLVGANTAYDVGVAMEAWPETIPAWFEAYEAGRVRDVQIDEMLIDIAKGQLGGYVDARTGKKAVWGYTLAEIEQRYLGIDRTSEKNDPDAWRLRYSTFDGVPLSEWPKAAIDYACADATGAREVSAAQWTKYGNILAQESYSQARAALALHLMSAWGVRTHRPGVEALRSWVKARFDFCTKALQEAGLVRPDGSRDTKKAKARAVYAYMQAKRAVPLTAAGLKAMAELGREPTPAEAAEIALAYCSLDKDACEDAGDELLDLYAERTSLVTVVDTHIPALEAGLHTPIQPRYVPLVASGRTACKGASKKGGPTNGFQIQNPKRASYDENEVQLPGVRECFASRGWIARERFRVREAEIRANGHALAIRFEEGSAGGPFADADFTGLELCTVAQSCIDIVGFSKLGDAINAGLDPHLIVAAQILGITYDEAKARKSEHEVKEARQVGKVANFGFGGGLGARGFSKFARKGYGVRISEAEAREIKDAWLRSWPEFEGYFAAVKEMCRDGLAQIIQLRSGRVRGMVEYTAACNTFFQGLGADGAKRAAWEVALASYARPEHVLYGFRPWGFIHDQIVGETLSLAVAHEQAVALGQVMVAACNRYLPNVPVKCSPCLSWTWCKDAVAVFDAPPKDGGRLVPWDEAKDQKWRVFDEGGKEVKWA